MIVSFSFILPDKKDGTDVGKNRHPFACYGIMKRVTNDGMTDQILSPCGQRLKSEICVIPEGAFAGFSVYGFTTIYWYDAESTAAIISHVDPLNLNAATGEMTTADGEVVATAMTSTSDGAYAAMPLNSEDSGMGSIYYVSSYFTTDAVNPLNVEKYTEAEVAAIVSDVPNNHQRLPVQSIDGNPYFRNKFGSVICQPIINDGDLS